MKALLQAAWLLTTAFGSLIVIVVAESKIIQDQTAEFLFFAALQTFVSLVFAVMARVYVTGRRQRQRPASPDDEGEGTSLLLASKIEG